MLKSKFARATLMMGQSIRRKCLNLPVTCLHQAQSHVSQQTRLILQSHSLLGPLLGDHIASYRRICAPPKPNCQMMLTKKWNFAYLWADTENGKLWKPSLAAAEYRQNTAWFQKLSSASPPSRCLRSTRSSTSSCKKAFFVLEVKTLSEMAALPGSR